MAACKHNFIGPGWCPTCALEQDQRNQANVNRLLDQRSQAREVALERAAAAQAAYQAKTHRLMSEQIYANREAQLRQQPRWYDAIAESLAAPHKASLPVPSAERLARALWLTDDRVQDFVGRMSEAKSTPDPEATRRGRIERLAWERDEGGWRSEAERRAKRMLTDGELDIEPDSPKTMT